MMFILTLRMEQIDDAPLQAKEIDYVRRLLHTYDPSVHCGDQFLDPNDPMEPHRWEFCYQTEQDGAWEHPSDFDLACKDALGLAYETMKKATRELEDVRVWVEAQHFPEG